MSNTRPPVVGALVGGSIGAALFALERFVLRRNAGGFLRRLPFLPYLGLRSLLYASVILLIDAVAAELAHVRPRSGRVARRSFTAALSQNRT